MAMQVEDAPHPYFAMIGNFGTPTWSDTAVSYLAFYHLLAKGLSLPDAVEAMKIASGDHRWVVETAEGIKRDYMEFVKTRVEPETAQRDLETVAQQENLSPDAKALEGTPRG